MTQPQIAKSRKSDLHISQMQDDTGGDMGQAYVADQNQDTEDDTDPNMSMPSAETQEGQSPLDQNPIMKYPEIDHHSLLSNNNKSLSNSVGTSGLRVPHPRARKNPKTIGMAVFLFLGGLAFLAAAFLEFLVGSSTRGTIFLIISLLMGLPGALKGRPGYQFSGIPSFDV